MSSIDFNNISFDLPKNQSNVIKVIGVGGGGSNAVNHMFSKGIKGVDFVICNTDSQALHNSPVPIKIQLGATLTEGLGAGANPIIGEEAAKESIEEIRNMLDRQSKMLFITVGMGGGTGTGAAPVIAKVAREMDILTVGIVTTPFAFEGKMRNEQAQTGIEKLREHVDSLVIINNNKLREVFGNLGFKAGFSKADEVLSTAATGIAQVITHHYTQNIDLRDAKTVLSDSGTAIMGSATASGSNRAQDVITKALDSPLLNDNRITGAKKVLLLIVSGATEVTIDEIGEINDYIQSEAKTNVDIIMGVGEDESLGDAISVTIIATGFTYDQQEAITALDSKKIIHKLEDNTREKEQVVTPVKKETKSDISEPVVRHTLEEVNEEKPEDPKDHIAEKINKIKEDVDEDDFIIFDSHTEDVEETVTESENQIEFTFDLPIKESATSGSANIKQTNDVREMEIIDMEVVRSEEPKKEKIKYTLEIEEEYSPEIRVLNEMKEDEDMKIELKIDQNRVVEEPKQTIVREEETTENENITEEDVSPLNLTISELRKRADERRRKMKDFNYKFINRLNQNIDDIESQPAYKRMGVDIDGGVPSSDNSMNKSRTTLNLDENDEIQFRSNNSFLHDNVD
jgi:cell division protein FtsZ